MKILKNKLLTTAGILTIGGMLISGCKSSSGSATTGHLFVPAATNNPNLTPQQRKSAEAASKFYYFRSQAQAAKEAGEATGKALGRTLNERDYGRQVQLPPEHLVVKTDGLWYPKPRYEWVSPNPDKDRDYRVREAQDHAFLTFKWRDINKNNKIGNNEVDYGKKFFNLDKETMSVLFSSRNKEGIVTFKSLTDTGKLIGETTTFYEKRVIIIYSTKSTIPAKVDFMNKLKRAGPGDYRITATFKDGESYSIDVKIVK